MSSPGQGDLPPHEILGPVGDFPFRTVYQARDAASGHVVALTILHIEALTPEGPERFLRELRAAAVLRHPHLLPIFAIGRHDGRPAYTTPLPAGGDLAGHRQQFAEPRAAGDLIEKLARAAAAAHAHGLLHGDLNPQVVHFDEHGEPRVGGFGQLPFLCSVLRDGPGLVVGRLAYVAPERIALAPGAIDAPTDVWAAWRHSL